MRKKVCTNRQQITGILGVAIGLAVVFFATSHSPNLSLMEAAVKAQQGEWVLKEPYYYGILIIGIVFILSGVITIIQSFNSTK